MPTPEQQAAMDAANARLKALAGSGEPYVAPKAVADIGHTQASTAEAGARTGLIGVQTQTAAANLEAKREEREAAEQKVLADRGRLRDDTNNALQVVQRIRGMLGPYSASTGSLLSVLPGTEANDFKTAVAQLNAIKFMNQIQVLKSGTKTGTPGIGRITVVEVPLMTDKIGALRPDNSIKSILGALDSYENYARKAYARANAPELVDSPDPKVQAQLKTTFGYVDDPSELKFKGTPMPNFDAQQPGGKLLSVGADTKAGPTIPLQMQVEYDAGLQDHLKSGDYPEWRDKLDAKYGFTSGLPQQLDVYRAYQANASKQLDKGIPLDTQIPAPNVQATEFEKKRAELMADPLTGIPQSILAGVLSNVKPLVAALPGDQQDSLNKLELMKQAYPTAGGLGELGGAIGADVGLTALGVPPVASLAGLGAMQAYDPEHPFTSAALGAGLGTVGGKLAEKATQLATGVLPNVQTAVLNEAGIPMTTGELLGGFSRRAEDALAKTPLAGLALKTRRAEGEAAFQKAAADLDAKGAQELSDHTIQVNKDALQAPLDPIGLTHSGTIGADGIAEVQRGYQRAYRDALEGVDVPVTDAFKNAATQAVTNAADQGMADPGAISRTLAPFLNLDSMDGPAYQRLLERLADLRNAARTSGNPDISLIRDATGAIENAATSMVGDVSPEVAANLQAANASRRLGGVVEDAASNSLDTGGVFSPQTLRDSMVRQAQKFEGKAALARGRYQPSDIETNLPMYNMANKAVAERQALVDAQDAAKQRLADTQAGLPVAAPTAPSVSPAADELDRLTRAYGAVTGAPSRGSRLAGGLGVALPSLAAAGDIALHAYGDQTHGPTTSDVAARDLGLLALAAGAPNLAYSKFAQNLLNKRLLATATGDAGSTLLRKYLPVAVGAGAGTEALAKLGYGDTPIRFTRAPQLPTAALPPISLKVNPVDPSLLSAYMPPPDQVVDLSQQPTADSGD